MSAQHHPPADSPGPGDVTPPRIDSPEAAARALCWGFEKAFAHQARSITCVSTRFAGWPLDDAALLASLSTWLRLPQRRLLLLASDFRGLGLRFPRFDQWRRNWVHAVPAWCCPEELAPSLPEALFDDHITSVQVFDFEAGRGRASQDRRQHLLLAQQTDAVLQRSEASWPVKALGL